MGLFNIFSTSKVAVKNPMDSLVTIALKEVGVVETPPKSNKGVRVKEYQSTTTYSKDVPTGWAWCAAFVCWCVKEWLMTDSLARDKLGIKSDIDLEKFRPKTAAAWGFDDWAKPRGLKILKPSNLAKKGDIVMYDFSHVGIVTKDQSSIRANIETVEGNTNNRGEREGGGVYRKVRSPNEVQCYVRIL